eukprot:TRINITY_DN55095_c0_g1_i1.p1 TRINITY_DN55095_c0_g1~~TRINITY_DN55095_c0_g1_i1.p1  ORF type:complete len:562 (+),score=58.18 TRINITY_DN55095_c0_g1_i1:44-1729(+)
MSQIAGVITPGVLQHFKSKDVADACRHVTNSVVQVLNITHLEGRFFILVSDSWNCLHVAVDSSLNEILSGDQLKIGQLFLLYEMVPDSPCPRVTRLQPMLEYRYEKIGEPDEIPNEKFHAFLEAHSPTPRFSRAFKDSKPDASSPTSFFSTTAKKSRWATPNKHRPFTGIPSVAGDPEPSPGPAPIPATVVAPPRQNGGSQATAAATHVREGINKRLTSGSPSPAGKERSRSAAEPPSSRSRTPRESTSARATVLQSPQLRPPETATRSSRTDLYSNDCHRLFPHEGPKQSSRQEPTQTAVADDALATLRSFVAEEHEANRRKVEELERENARIQSFSSLLKQFGKIIEDAPGRNPLHTLDNFLYFYKHFILECSKQQLNFAQRKTSALHTPTTELDRLQPTSSGGGAPSVPQRLSSRITTTPTPYSKKVPSPTAATPRDASITEERPSSVADAYAALNEKTERWFLTFIPSRLRDTSTFLHLFEQMRRQTGADQEKMFILLRRAQQFVQGCPQSATTEQLIAMLDGFGVALRDRGRVGGGTGATVTASGDTVRRTIDLHV